jgi:hypothetical protein
LFENHFCISLIDNQGIHRYRDGIDFRTESDGASTNRLQRYHTPGCSILASIETAGRVAHPVRCFQGVGIPDYRLHERPTLSQKARKDGHPGCGK